MTTRLAIEARPGSRKETIAWDPWRTRWVVHTPARAVHGEANLALLRALAGWLGVGEGDLRWVRGERSSRKVLEVRGLDELEARRRLSRAEESTTAR